MSRLLSLLLLSITAASCARSDSEEYIRAVECYAAQSALYEGSRNAGVPVPSYQQQAAQTVIGIYRDRARNVAKASGDGHEKVEADVQAFLADFAKRYQASKDKPSLDREIEAKLRACAETLR